MFTASAQKCFAMLVSWIMVLAISCKVLFFRSTTPFCCGVLGQEKSWEIPFGSNKPSKSLFYANGICHDFSCSRTPQQNGVVEQEKSWEIPFASNKPSKSLFSNSPP